MQGADLNSRFGIPGIAKVVLGNGELSKVVISTRFASGEMYLHGAHVTSWKPKDPGEVLYLSPNVTWAEGRAIRGGVPISFPWFADRAGDPTAPPHGFVRTRSWRLVSIDSVEDGVAVTMSTESDESTRKWWPFDFLLTCRTTFGPQLKIELVVRNTGTESFAFEEALHAYFRVGDSQTATIHGLDHTQFIDKIDNRAEKIQMGDLSLSSETDRVYLNTSHALELFDPADQRRTRIEKQNSNTTVVWNPWSEKARSMADLGVDQWRHFICIETSNVRPSAVTLGPGEQHSMAATISAAPWQKT